MVNLSPSPSPSLTESVGSVTKDLAEQIKAEVHRKELIWGSGLQGVPHKKSTLSPSPLASCAQAPGWGSPGQLPPHLVIPLRPDSSCEDETCGYRKTKEDFFLNFFFLVIYREEEKVNQIQGHPRLHESPCSTEMPPRGGRIAECWSYFGQNIQEECTAIQDVRQAWSSLLWQKLN